MSAEKISVEDSVRQAIDELAEKENDANDTVADEPTDTKIDPKPRAGDGKFIKKAKEKVEKEHEETPEKDPETAETQKTTEKPENTVTAPQSWSATAKAQWAKVPDGLKAEIIKRESDIHKKLTSNEEEFNLGKSMKEVMTPYIPLIQAEGGGSLSTVVQGLLNTAYQLRTASAEQKAQVVKNICKTYGVDLSQLTQQNQQKSSLPPEYQILKQELDQVRNQVTQEKTLQQQQEQARVTSEIQAFAANPKNTYFEQVRTHMGALFGSGQAKDLQEAYDAACWANPQIRSILIAEQETSLAEKRKSEVAQKKKAAVSVTGSPGVTSPNSGTPKHKSAEESVREALDELRGAKI